jgi:hypothetical protein
MSSNAQRIARPHAAAHVASRLVAALGNA